MKLSKLIKELQHQQKRTSGDPEVRKGIYNGQTEVFEGVYFDEDENAVIIH